MDSLDRVQPAQPQRQRVLSLDVLRGVAILGILPMNIQFFAMIEPAFYNPLAGPFNDTANVWIWKLTHVLLGMKDLTIFSMLFGAGIVMMDAHCRRSDRSATALHYRRMVVLLVFGVVHAYFIWFGDILYHYALCGCLVYWCRNLRNRTLILLGVTAYGIMLLIMYSGSIIVPLLPTEAVQQIYSSFEGTTSQVQRFESVYSGSWWTQMQMRVPAALSSETINFAGYMLWAAGGMMLVGMALYRMGVLEARCPDRWYVTMIVIALVAGLPVVLFGMHRDFAGGFSADYSMYQGRVYSEAAAPLMALGWLSIVILVCKHGLLPRLTRLLAAVGRMALTNYIMQSLICSFIFYGHGLGLVNELGRPAQLGITVAVWCFQLVFSELWLRRYPFGPLEWLWRRLTYGHRLSLRGDEDTTPTTASRATRTARAPHVLRNAMVFGGLVLAAHVVLTVVAIVLHWLLPIPAERIFEVLTGIAMVPLSWVCVRWLYHRSLRAIGLGMDRRWWRDSAYGLFAGFGLMVLVWLILRLAGQVVTAVNPDLKTSYIGLPVALLFCMFIALHEELLCRGFLLQVLAKRSRFVAIVVTGLLFISLHVGTPGWQQPLTIINLLLAHLLYVVIYFRTRSLWPLLGLHTAWNFTLAFVIGLPLSGLPPKFALLHSGLKENLWAGNQFGPEGGLVISIVLAAATLFCWRALPQQQPASDLLYQ